MVVVDGVGASGVGVGGGDTLVRPPWLAHSCSTKDLTWFNMDKFLPKFDWDNKEETLEIFVNRFMLSL